MCSVLQAITGVNKQLGYLVTQSDNVFKESVSLRSEQIGMNNNLFTELNTTDISTVYMWTPSNVHHLLHFFVTEVESEVADKLKYIEETKETMDKNTKKLSEIVQDISGIQAGKMIFCYFTHMSFLTSPWHTLTYISSFFYLFASVHRQNTTAPGVHPEGSWGYSQPLSRGPSNCHPHKQQGWGMGQQHEKQWILHSCLWAGRFFCRRRWYQTQEYIYMNISKQ